MAEDRITRLLAMQRQLLCGNAIDKAAAAAEYGVSAKSIQRDLETLRGWFGTQGNNLIYDREADAYRLLQPEEARLTKSEVLAVCKILLGSRAFTEAVLDRLPTARVVAQLPEGGQVVEAEVFDGNGLDMWVRSQGKWVEMMPQTSP